MTNEIPEMPEEMLTISKDSLKKISFLVEKLNLDLHGEDKTRKAAAAVMIHIIMGALSNKQTIDSFLKGDSND